MSNTNPKLAALTTKLIAAQATVAKIQGEIDALSKYDNLEVGGLVGFEFGRGDKKQNLQGEVVATGMVGNVDSVVVLIGKGTIDTSTKRIPRAHINAYVPPVKIEVGEIVTAPAADEPVKDAFGGGITSPQLTADELGDPLAGDNHINNIDALLG